MSEDALRTIAAGGEPAWEGTYEHPQYGSLTFRVPKMPKSEDWLRHAIKQDQLIVAYGGNPNDVGSGTAMLAAAIAGVRREDGYEPIVKPPVINEERLPDPDTPGHERIEKRYYDPLADEGTDIAMQAWLEFCAWRMGLLEKVGELGEGSGATSGSASADSSPDPTASLSTIPA
jgi:hypothetical protein